MKPSPPHAMLGGHPPRIGLTGNMAAARPALARGSARRDDSSCARSRTARQPRMHPTTTVSRRRRRASGLSLRPSYSGPCPSITEMNPRTRSSCAARGEPHAARRVKPRAAAPSSLPGRGQRGWRSSPGRGRGRRHRRRDGADGHRRAGRRCDAPTSSRSSHATCTTSAGYKRVSKRKRFPAQNAAWRRRGGWLMAAEYVMACENYKLCCGERGVAHLSDHSRNTLDLSDGCPR